MKTTTWLLPQKFAIVWNNMKTRMIGLTDGGRVLRQLHFNRMQTTEERY